MKGWYFKKNENDSSGAFFPASGYRNSSGGLADVGIYGDYWSAGVNSAVSAYSLYFSSVGVYPFDSNYRAYAYPVRPVKGGGA